MIQYLQKHQNISESTSDEEECSPRVETRRKRRDAFLTEPADPQDLQNFVPIVIPKTDAEKKQIRDILSENFLFSSLDHDQMELVINAMKRKSYTKGQWIIQQGADGDDFYVVANGTCETFIKFPSGEMKMVKDYSTGGSFGEIALMKNTKRAASIQATSDVVEMWALDRATFRHVVTSLAFAKRNKYEQFLSQVPLLNCLEDYDRARLADSLVELEFDAGEDIIIAGDSSDQNFYILLEGVAIALKRLSPRDTSEVVVKKYDKGGYFGELALLDKTVRAATVRAETKCKVVRVSRDTFERLLGPVHNLLKRERENYTKVEEALKKVEEK